MKIKKNHIKMEINAVKIKIVYQMIGSAANKIIILLLLVLYWVCVIAGVLLVSREVLFLYELVYVYGCNNY